MTNPSSYFALPRWLTFAAAALVVLVVLFATTGDQFAPVLIGVVTDTAVLIAWIFSALGYAHLLPLSLREGVGGGVESVERQSISLNSLFLFVTRIALGLGLLSLVLLLLGLAGLLNSLASPLLLLLGLALLLWHHRKASPKAVLAWLRSRSPSTLPAAMLAIPLAIMLLGAQLYPALLWKPLDPHPYDVMSYHLQIPREWYDAGRIMALPHNVFSYFPMGVEMHYLLAMHLQGGPWAGMYLCQMMSSAFAMLAALAVVGGVRQLGGANGLAWIAGLSSACVPWSLMLGSVCYVEPALMLYGTLAAVWAVLAAGDWHAKRSMLLVGLLLGFACGVKYTAVAMTVVPVLVLWPLAAWQTLGRSLWKPLFVGLIACGVSFSPWLIRNAVWAKNPIFPLATSLFGGGSFSADQVDRFRVAHAPPPAEQGAKARLSATWDRVFVDFQFSNLKPTVGLPALTLIAAMVLIVRRQQLYLVALLGCGGLVWLFATHDMPRFLSPLIPLGVLVIALAANRCQTPQVITAAILVVFAGVGIGWVWQTLSPTLEYGRAGFFRLSNPSAIVLPDLLPALRTNGPIALIGDAAAFNLPVDSRHLLYRNVFDVEIPPGANEIDGWLGRSVDQLRQEGYWVVISPDELQRLSRTYAHIPPPPAPFDQPGQPQIVLPPTSDRSSP